MKKISIEDNKESSIPLMKTADSTPKEIMSNSITGSNKIKLLDACNVLAISPQTAYNWRTKNSTRELVKPAFYNHGRFIWVDIEALKLIIQKNEMVFGNARDYLYKQTTPKNVENRINRKFISIQQKIIADEPISKYQEDFYREQCRIKDVPCYLDKGFWDSI